MEFSFLWVGAMLCVVHVTHEQKATFCIEWQMVGVHLTR